MRVMDDRTIVSRMLAGVVAGLLLHSPAAANAADLTVPAICFASGQRLTLSGTAFTPGTPIAIAGDITGAARDRPVRAERLAHDAEAQRRDIGGVRLVDGRDRHDARAARAR